MFNWFYAEEKIEDSSTDSLHCPITLACSTKVLRIIHLDDMQNKKAIRHKK